MTGACVADSPVGLSSTAHDVIIIPRGWSANLFGSKSEMYGVDVVEFEKSEHVSFSLTMAEVGGVGGDCRSLYFW